jgi:prepilin-type processing-associated H-X9-DG protein
MKTQSKSNGFTRLELVVTLAVVAMLGGLLVPVLARDQSVDSRTFCRARLGRLSVAMALYAQEYGGWLPPNIDDGNTAPGQEWCPGEAGIGQAQEFNPDILQDPTRALLRPYLGQDISVYKCPADQRVGRYQGTNAAWRGKMIPSVRTVSLNGAVGTNPYRSGKYPTDGPWLDGNHGHTANRVWYCYGKMSDFIRPGPKGTLTFIEEDARSLNDAGFTCIGPSTPQNYEMIDWPGTYHDMAGAVAFADGHVEMHRWSDGRTKLTGSAVTSTQPGNVDILWLSDRVSAKISTSAGR